MVPKVPQNQRPLIAANLSGKLVVSLLPSTCVWQTLRKVWKNAAAVKPLQSCPTLCDPIDGSPPGSPVPEILQARTLEWVAIFFSDMEK